MHELRDALERIEAGGDLRAAVFTAAGVETGAGIFSTGFTAGAAAGVLSETPERQPPYLLANLRVPTIAALFGRVEGAAVELALACDVRIAAEDARFSVSALAAGSFPCWGGTQRLSRIVGIGRALEMVLLGEPIPAADALAYGLVTRLVPRADLVDEAHRVAKAWSKGAPVALAYLKDAVRKGGDLPLDHALRLEWDLAVLLETTSDRAEGIQAFREKREPHFTGQ